MLMYFKVNSANQMHSEFCADKRRIPTHPGQKKQILENSTECVNVPMDWNLGHEMKR